MKCTPVLLNNLEGKAIYLKRIESKAKDEKTEDWLQNLLYENPELLPVQEFDESFAPLISLGREVEGIDILYVSPLGKLTIVETKLWKNKEKHRTVVAQIIDYAKEMSHRSYDQLNEYILKSSRKKIEGKKASIEQIVTASQQLKHYGLSFSDFQERLIINLQTGEFLLLIVGDRISPNVALLTEAIHGAPGLSFSIGLIELQLHKIKEEGEWPLLVIPDIVGKTIEKIRGVVKIQYEKKKPEVEVKVSREESKQKITQEIFLQKVPDDLRPVYEQWLETWNKEKYAYVYWGTGGFTYRIQIQGKPITIVEAYPEWSVSVIREIDAKNCNATEKQYQKYLNRINNISAAMNKLSLGQKFVYHNTITSEDLMIMFSAASEFAKEVKDK